MKLALILSIAVKGIGAVFEIASQILITRFGGVELFGEYCFYVSITEIICWVLFSGIVKTNAFYIANGKDTRRFRRGYFILMLLPFVVAAAIFGVHCSALFALAIAAAYIYGMQMNLSSIFLACRRYKVSLFGEYLISRAFIFGGIIILISANSLDIYWLVAIYSCGYCASVAYFLLMKRSLTLPERTAFNVSTSGVIGRHIRFQLTDVANGMISQVPIIVQYLFSGAFQAGLLSVVLVTRKVISFIAGPTAKIYLPEFAKRFGDGDLPGLRSVYRDIVLLQMCFILPIALLLIVASKPILFLYNPTLVEYEGYMRFAAFVFLGMSLFGPQGNLLSMVGKEGVEMWSKWVSLAAMIVVMVVAFGDELFVLYGIAAQVLADSAIKLHCLIKALHGFPITATDWIKMGLPFVLCALAASMIPTSMLGSLLVSIIASAVLMVALMLLFFRNSVTGIVRGIIGRN